ncbi:MAG TPA: sterol desaturase family protein [Bacteroidia bacterium]|jgi:lathosterol oxidase|nr:sterol desaturase family protein [Bacteroidia bacterium]
MTDTNKRLKIGEGKISGYWSIFLAVLSFLAVFCFKFPELLTTPEFRAVYKGEDMEKLLTCVIIASFFFAVLSFILSKKKSYAVIGMLISTLTILLGGFQVKASVVGQSSWHLGLDWLLLDLLLMALIFVPIEMLWPKNREQTRFHEEWRTDLVYFVIGHLFIQFFGILISAPAIAIFGRMGLTGLHTWVQHLPFVVALFFVFVITDLFQYWTHRFFHSHVFLWRFHSVHHSTQNMDWLAGSRTHFVDVVVTRCAVFLPLYVLGFSPVIFSIYVLFMAVHAVLIHSNTRINFGPLKYIITTPQYHFWHHCEDPKYYGKNFATVFPFIDRIFGTYYLPGNEWPEGTGVHEGQYPKGYMKQLVHPFTKSPFDTDLKMEDRAKR